MHHRAPAISLILALLATPTVADADLTATARTYVENFFGGEYASYVDLMADPLKAAFPESLAKRVHGQLLGANGALKELGEAWLEAEDETYRRVRVPAVFENGTSDLQVVFDKEGKVAGFTQAPHVPSPAEMAADPSLRAEPNPAFEGRWSGTLEIPGSPLNIQVELNFKDGYWVGTIDIPAQGAKGLPLSNVTVGETDATFSISGVPGEPTFHGKLVDGELTGDFTQGAGGASFRLNRDELAGPARPQEPKPPFPYESQDVTFKNGDTELAGTLTLPDGEGPFPTALLITGSGQQDRNSEIFDHKPFLVLADHLTRAGIAVLRVDDRGAGESGGSAADATSHDFANDTLAGVNYLLTRKEIDEKKLGLIGHSEGGIIASIVATRSKAVAWIVLLAGPAVPGREILLRQVELLSRAEGMSEGQITEAVASQTEVLKLIESNADDEKIRGKVRALLRTQTGGAISD
jgi:pimeloyl-ACP methyl ester carboxylesterase